MEVYKRGKTWMYRVKYYDSEGKRKSISKSGFSTSKEAKIAGIDVETKHLQSGISKKENVSFVAYSKEWIETYKKGNITEHSYYIYSLIPVEIENHFKDTKLKDVTKMEYQKMLNTYGKTHVKESISKLNSRIRAIVQDAIQERIIYTDFTHGVTIASQKASKPEEAKYINENDAKALKSDCLKHASMNKMVNYEIIFSLMTGCRIGEVSGLTWDNVHFKKKTVYIKHGFDYSKVQDFKKVKTETSDREIAISNSLITILKQLKKEQQELFLKKGYRDEQNLVFKNSNFNIISDSAANQALSDKLKKLEIFPIITFHGLRHTHASILISHGVDIAYVSQRLGHKNIAITLSTYAHLLQNGKKEQEEKTNQILDENLG